MCWWDGLYWLLVGGSVLDELVGRSVLDGMLGGCVLNGFVGWSPLG